MTFPHRGSGVATPAEFRQGMRHLAGAVTVVAARLADGSPIGIAMTAVCSVSAEPAALLVCVNRTTSLGRNIAAGMPFSVNVLGAGHEVLARAFGGMLGLDQSARFAIGDWRDAPNGAPSLADAPAVFGCHATHLVDHASHIIVIGHVDCVTVAEHASDLSTLIYLNGAFGHVDAAV
jgi:flavin reductase